MLVPHLRPLVLASSLALLATALGAQTIELGSIASARFDTTWTLDGEDMEEARAKLLEALNFSPGGGDVPYDVAITDTAGPIDSTLLADFDVFFIGYLADGHVNAFSAAELDAFYDWVEAGGAMLITCDNSGHDAVCARFGSPVTGEGDTLVDASGPGFGHPALVGPFGPVRQVTAQFDIATFDEPADGDVVLRSALSRDPMGIVREIGDGRVLLLGDVDMLSDFTLTNDNLADIASANDALLGNAIAWLAGVAETGLCTPTATTLCLDGMPGDGRFAVTVDYSTIQGGGLSGTALATPLLGLGARQGGLFTFFDPANPEMVLKILDGCIINNHFWVYASAGTNVGMTVTIEDLLLGGPPKLYVNPDLNPAPPVQDVNALPCF